MEHNKKRDGANPVVRVSVEDSLAYNKEVKETFHDQGEKYDMFCEVLKAFKANRIDTSAVVVRLEELFKGHNNLIRGLKQFLTNEYCLSFIQNENLLKKYVEFEYCLSPIKNTNLPHKHVEYEDALAFIEKIRQRFADGPIYKSFLDILKVYRTENMSLDEVYRKVSELFKDHPDLLDEFERFMPCKGEASSTLTDEVTLVNQSCNIGDNSIASTATSMIHRSKI